MTTKQSTPACSKLVRFPPLISLFLVQTTKGETHEGSVNIRLAGSVRETNALAYFATVLIMTLNIYRIGQKNEKKKIQKIIYDL